MCSSEFRRVGNTCFSRSRIKPAEACPMTERSRPEVHRHRLIVDVRERCRIEFEHVMSGVALTNEPVKLHAPRRPDSAQAHPGVAERTDCGETGEVHPTTRTQFQVGVAQHEIHEPGFHEVEPDAHPQGWRDEKHGEEGKVASVLKSRLLENLPEADGQTEQTRGAGDDAEQVQIPDRGSPWEQPPPLDAERLGRDYGNPSRTIE